MFNKPNSLLGPMVGHHKCNWFQD